MIVPMMLAAAAPEEAPLWEMVPVVEMADRCPLPAASWGKRESFGDEDRRIISVIFDGDELSWEGQPVDEAKLRERARAVQGYKSTPRIYFYSGKNCAETRRIAALIASEANCTPANCVVSPTPLRAVRIPPPPAPPAPPIQLTMPAPPAPPPRVTGPSIPNRKLAPAGSPQNWVTNDDYPAAALRAEQSGAVSFRLDVDGTGMPMHCTVTGSSGSAILDSTTCALLMRRARFVPALDQNRRPVASAWSSRMRWELPEGYEPTPPTLRLSWTNVSQFTIAEDGTLSGCSDEYFGTPGKPKEDFCATIETTIPLEMRAQMRGNSKGPVTLMYRYVHSVAGRPMDPVPKIPTGFQQIAMERKSFQVSETGAVSQCSFQAIPKQPADSPSPCEEADIYIAAPGNIAVTVTQTILTTGDTNVIQSSGAEDKKP